MSVADALRKTRRGNLHYDKDWARDGRVKQVLDQCKSIDTVLEKFSEQDRKVTPFVQNERFGKPTGTKHFESSVPPLLKKLLSDHPKRAEAPAPVECDADDTLSDIDILEIESHDRYEERLRTAVSTRLALLRTQYKEICSRPSTLFDYNEDTAVPDIEEVETSPNHQEESAEDFKETVATVSYVGDVESTATDDDNYVFTTDDLPVLIPASVPCDSEASANYVNSPTSQTELEIQRLPSVPPQPVTVAPSPLQPLSQMQPPEPFQPLQQFQPTQTSQPVHQTLQRMLQPHQQTLQQPEPLQTLVFPKEQKNAPSPQKRSERTSNVHVQQAPKQISPVVGKPPTPPAIQPEKPTKTTSTNNTAAGNSSMPTAVVEPAFSIDTMINKQIVETYISLQDDYHALTKRIEWLTKPVDRSATTIRTELTKAVNHMINTLTEHTRSQYQGKLISLFHGENIEVQSKRLKLNRQADEFCCHLLALKLVNRAEKIVVDDASMLQTLALFTIVLWLEKPLIGTLVKAIVYLRCPHLIPYVISRDKFRNDANGEKEYYKSMGYNYDEENNLETHGVYFDRAAAICRYWTTLICFKLPVPYKQATHPLGLRCAWQFLATAVQQPPIRDITARILLEFLKLSAADLRREYGKQYLKLLRFLDKIYMPRITKVSTGNVESLKSFLKLQFSAGR